MSIKFRATARIRRPDNGHCTTRTIEFEASDQASAARLVEQEIRAGGYSGYVLEKVVSLEAV